MNDNKSPLTFRKWYLDRQEKKLSNDNSVFCIICGMIMMVSGGMGYLYKTSVWFIFSCIIMVLGLITTVFGGFFPKLTRKPIDLLKKLLGFIGSLLTKVLLLPIYLVITLINIFVKKSQRHNLMYCYWNDEENIKPTFTSVKTFDRKKTRFAVFQIISDIFSSLSEVKLLILFPVAVVLIMLGIVLFFASSNAVFSFVYTLF